MNKCKHCGADTKNARFCSRSCSASYNNAGVRRHQGESTKCVDCDVVIQKGSTRCKTCHGKTFHYGDMTLLEARNEKHLNNGGGVNALVRYRARKFMLDNYTECVRCGYDKHIEAAHVKPIADFDENALISEINNSENIIALCPNCHWEFDYGELTLDEINAPLD